ncbi:MAG: hypothetical protein ACOYMF_05430 [Bacteroidales bacterium]
MPRIIDNIVIDFYNPETGSFMASSPPIEISLELDCKNEDEADKMMDELKQRLHAGSEISFRFGDYFKKENTAKNG